MRIKSLTPAEQDTLNQLQYLDGHFKAAHGMECFSQSVAQLVSFLGYTRRTIQNSLRKLESLGLVSIAYNQGFRGANLFYIHLDKIEELVEASLEASTTACDKVKALFKLFIKASQSDSKSLCSEPVGLIGEPLENVSESFSGAPVDSHDAYSDYCNSFA